MVFTIGLNKEATTLQKEQFRFGITIAKAGITKFQFVYAIFYFDSP
jgi:hypothetical protein